MPHTAGTIALTAGSTYRFRLTAKKDGSAWDLTTAVVKLYLRDPDGALLTKTATRQSPYTAGTAYYDSLTTDIATVGDWTRTWEVDDGSVVQKSVPVPFSVVAAP